MDLAASSSSSSMASIFSSSSFVVDISELDDPCSPSSSSSSSSSSSFSFAAAAASAAEAAAAAAGGDGDIDSADPSLPRPLPFSFVIACCGSRRKKVAAAVAVGCGPPWHFLDACFLCKRRIPVNSDVFMYRGDAPFCSEECREEQMKMDKALEQERRRYRMTSSSLTAAGTTLPTSTNYAIDKNSTMTTKDNEGRVISIRRSPTINLRAGTAAVVAG